jgi:hypothetical protein
MLCRDLTFRAAQAQRTRQETCGSETRHKEATVRVNSLISAANDTEEAGKIDRLHCRVQ